MIGEKGIPSRPRRPFRPLVSEAPPHPSPKKGRGASWSPANRFEALHIEVVEEGLDEEDRPVLQTRFYRDFTTGGRWDGGGSAFGECKSEANRDGSG